MISALVSFLGGSVFRMLWGELSAWLTKAQDHKHELDRMHLQAELDRGQHERNIESIRVQAELGVKTIQVQAEAAIGELEAQGWVEAVKGTTKTVGIKWVDAWNAVIRPGVATWAVLMMTAGELGLMLLSDNTLAVTGAALGIYLADRNLMKRGK
jgi:cytochrome c biogenesis protein ResB